jgi:aconitate hydratase
MASNNSFRSRDTLTVDGQPYTFYRLDALSGLAGNTVARLPFSLRVLLENLLRFEDGVNVTRADIEALLNWDPRPRPTPRSPSRRRACSCRTSPACPAWSTSPRCATRWRKLGGDPEKINPLAPVDLVIDHSVQVDEYGTPTALELNTKIEFERNGERYSSCAGARRPSQLQGRAAGHRHRAPGEPRVPGARRVRGEGRTRRKAYPDTSSAPTRTPR